MANHRGRAGRIVLAGGLAQRPRYGGHAWMFLQYLLGFRRLGFDVLFLDRVVPEMGLDEAAAAANLQTIFEPFGLEEDFAIARPGDREAGERVRDSDVLINVMGFIQDPDLLGAARRRVFLDIDPGFGQMWRELGLADIFKGHDRYVTVGANVGHEGCAVPACGLEWIATRPPVVLDEWPATSAGERITTVGAWRGPFTPVEYRGETYGLRVHEFRRFAPLPFAVDVPFEAALDIDASDAGDVALLKANRWLLIDPATVTATPDAYRAYVQASRAELGVAKNMYVHARAGWFSDRTACYLASGKPAIVEDTALPPEYCGGEGLITFSTLDEAVAGVEAVLRDPARHARAARELAESLFDSDRVLTSLIERVAA